MLQVPELKPEDTPFDPDFHTAMQGGVAAGRHVFATVAAKEGKLDKTGAILMGFQKDSGEDSGGTGTADKAQYHEAAFTRFLLDHAVVKDAVTVLHKEDDEQTAKLMAYSGIRIDDIVKDHDGFLRAQEAKYGAMFTEPRQKHMFQEMTREYFAMSMERAGALRSSRVREYQEEVIERQNSEFIERALRPENVFNDVLQTRYRDMILFNLENLMAELPEKERRQRMDTASAALYRKILDTRLELDPARLGNMLNASAIHRVLGEEAMEGYKDKVAAAIRDEELRYMAKQWVDDNIDPDAAKDRAQRDVPEKVERVIFLTYYDYWRYNDNRKNYLTRILNASDAWNSVMDGGLHPESIPVWVRRNDHGLRDFLLQAIKTREENGGLPSIPDYSRLADLAESYDPYKQAEKLRDKNVVYGLIAAMGGPDAPAFQTIIRLLLGKMTESDRSWLSALALAKREIQTAGGEEISKAEIQAFLERFDSICRIRREREETGELDELEIQEIIEKCRSLQPAL